MALTLNAVPMSASANSYATEAEGTAYIEGRLNGEAWTSATSAVKQQALVGATARLDQDEYDGTKTTTAQALKWPRLGLVDADGTAVGSTTIPAFLRQACIEEALASLQQPAGADASALAAFASVGIGPIAVTMRGNGTARTGIAKAASRLLARYRMGGNDQARINRG